MTTRGKINANRIARIVDILFIFATVSGILSVTCLGSVLADPDYLINISKNENQVILGALLDLVGVGAFVGRAIVIFPVFKKLNESIAIGYIVARGFEAVPFIIANLSLFSLLTLSKEYVGMASPDAANFFPVRTGL